MSTRRILGPAITLVALFSLAPLLSSSPSAGPEKSEQKSYALLAGTVFTAEGFSLPGVKVTIKRKGEKKPKWERVSDRRGEFAVRVPPDPATYEVTTHSDDRENQTKTVKVAGQERVDVFFRLPLKKSKEEDED